MRGFADQSKKDVDKQPSQPRYESGDMNLAELRDRRGPADRSQTAFIPVMKRRSRRGSAMRSVAEFNFPPNDLRDIAPFQNGHRRYARQHLARRVLERSEISDDENLRMICNAEIWLH